MKDGKLVEAQRLEQRTRFDLEMLNELGFCKGIEITPAIFLVPLQGMPRLPWWTILKGADRSRPDAI